MPKCHHPKEPNPTVYTPPNPQIHKSFGALYVAFRWDIITPLADILYCNLVHMEAYSLTHITPESSPLAGWPQACVTIFSIGTLYSVSPSGAITVNHHNKDKQASICYLINYLLTSKRRK